MPQYLFRESSGMLGPLVVVMSVIVLSLLICLGISIYAAHDLTSKVFELCIFVLVALSFILVFSIRLTLMVHSKDIAITYFPFKRFQFAREEVLSINILRIDPIADFGGWGLRSNKLLGRAFTTKGDHIAQFILKDGRKYCFSIFDIEAARRGFQQFISEIA